MPSSSYRSIVLAVGVISLVAGVVLALAPYSVAVEGRDWTRPCSSPLIGAFAGSDTVTGDEPPARTGCPSSARPRLVLALAFVVASVGAIALIRRETRPPSSLPPGPVPPSWEVDGRPPPD